LAGRSVCTPLHPR